MLGSLGNIGKEVVKKAITGLAILLARVDITGLVSNLDANTTSNGIDKLVKKWKRSSDSRKKIQFTYFK